MVSVGQWTPKERLALIYICTFSYQAIDHGEPLRIACLNKPGLIAQTLLLLVAAREQTTS